ncbi:MAG: ADP-ribosylglycohydrolase family protein [Chloroflexi bacterium]|nr:ADP-ribosylglycohydrolase family protein [Chloroflexota bacterium]
MEPGKQTTLENKFIGCLLGGAVGDALGFTSENMSRKRIQDKYTRLTDYKVRPSWGYYTDDTQLTIALAETLVANQGYDHSHFRRQLARWWLVFPRLSGRSTKNAAMKCLLGLRNTGRNVPGSSAAMRAAPLALFYYDDRPALLEKTVECSRVTHTHPAAIAGALVSVFSIAYCLAHTEFDRQAYLRELTDIAGEYDSELRQKLLSLEEMLAWPEEEVLKKLLSASKVIGSPITDIIPTAIYAFLKYPDDFEQTVLFCVNAGWDTDTMAAIVGNTSGAWNGLQGIPQRWVDRLERGYKGRDYIISLAQSLFERQSRIEPKNLLVDYIADWWRNTGFIFNMLTRKPMW